MNIQKQIAYKEVPKLEHKTIDRMINEIINRAELDRKENKASHDAAFKKWIMPEETKGYIHAKKNDPL